MNDLHSFIANTTHHSTRACSGYEHGAVIDKQGRLFTFGMAESGQLGLGYRLLLGEGGAPIATPPTHVELPEPVKSVSSGDYHTVVVTETGKLYAFGSCGNGKLGIGLDSDSYELRPVLVDLPLPVSMAACGDQHTVAILENGEVYSWGKGTTGQLGNGKLGNRLSPGLVSLPRPAIQVACSGNTTAIVTDDGSLYGCGANNWGQLGTGDNVERRSPTKVNIPDRVVWVAIGGSSTTIITSSGLLYRVGISSYLDSQIEIPEGAGAIIQVTGGSGGSLFLSADLSVYVCGGNRGGQLGTGDRDRRDTLTKIAMPEPIQDIICNMYQSFGVGVSGEVYVWGDNEAGQLGLTEIEDETVCVPTLLVL
ncbi:MAG: hypothetical protein WC208_16855 [Gallionella sp.]|jgi:alpha-tubulin suppressor-like RCC1 family protein